MVIDTFGKTLWLLFSACHSTHHLNDFNSSAALQKINSSEAALQEDHSEGAEGTVKFPLENFLASVLVKSIGVLP